RTTKRNPNEKGDQGEQYEGRGDPRDGREPWRGAVIENMDGRGKVAERVGYDAAFIARRGRSQRNKHHRKRPQYRGACGRYDRALECLTISASGSGRTSPF